MTRPDPYAQRLRDDPHRGAFRLFLLIHVAFWVLLPYLTRGVAPFDSTEALAWGLTWEWGTNKHPPLSGWLAEGFVRLLGDPDLTVYLLGQLCVAAALVYVRRLALGYVEPEAAFFSAVFLEGTIYYSFSAVEYNVNVLSLALVPAIVYYFWRAAQTGRTGFWLAAGLLGGLALLAKYTNVFLLPALGLWLAATPQGRNLLRSPGPWLAALTAFLIFLPHLAWLAHYDFLPLRYSQGKAAVAAPLSLAGLSLEPVRLFLAQAGNAAASIGLWAWLYAKTPRADRGRRRRPEAFLLCAGILPLGLLLATIGLLGFHGGTKWAYAFLGYIPLLLFFCLPASPPPALRRKALILTYAVLAAFGAGVAIKNLGATTASINIDGRALAETLKAAWSDTDDRPLRYVGGTLRLVSYLSTYLPERPRPVWNMDPTAAVWEDEKNIRAAGVLALALSENEYRAFQDRWPGLSAPRRLNWPFRAPLSRKEAMLTVFYGSLPPPERGADQHPTSLEGALSLSPREEK
ncbi:MAG: glycosyltransferase family 39 protein [Candidatus Adiutrix sp.]|nr:glycosyltransferase family 39 protein [Candidatus Adiutrix sp.]